MDLFCYFGATIWLLVLHCVPLQWHGPTLFTNDLRCASSTCVVHHGAQGGPNVCVCGGYVVHLLQWRVWLRLSVCLGLLGLHSQGHEAKFLSRA